MPIVANPDYFNPGFGQIASNLFTALNGNPELNMKRDYYGSETEKNLADAELKNQQGRFARGRADQQAKFIAAGGLDLSPLRPGESIGDRIFKNQASVNAALGIADNATDLANATRTLGGSQYAIGGTEDTAHTSANLFNRSMGIDDFGTAAGQAAGRTQEFKNRTDVANIGKQATLGAATIGANERWREHVNPAYVTTGAGETTNLSEEAAKNTGIARTITGQPTETTAKGGIWERISQGQQRPGDLQALELSHPPKEYAPREVSADDISKVELMVGQRHDNALEGKGNKTRLSQKFIQGLPAGGRVNAQRAAADVLARGGTAAQAADVYDRTLYAGQGKGQSQQQGAAAPAAASAPPKNAVHIKGDDDYNALPDGTPFLAPDGKSWGVKGSKGKAQQVEQHASASAAAAEAPVETAQAAPPPVDSEAAYGGNLPGLFAVREAQLAQQYPQVATAAPQPARAAMPTVIPFDDRRTSIDIQPPAPFPSDAVARVDIAPPGPTMDMFRGVSPTDAMRMANDQNQTPEMRRLAMIYVNHVLGGR